MDRWAEYDAGTLTPPVVVQRDTLFGEHLIWVWTGKRIIGPFTRKQWDASVEAEVLASAVAADPADPDQFQILCEDGETISGFVEDKNPYVTTLYSINLSINPTSQEVQAWNLIRPLLASHLRKVNKVYKRLGQIEQSNLRKHCPIFNAVMNLVEDEE